MLSLETVLQKPNIKQYLEDNLSFQSYNITDNIIAKQHSHRYYIIDTAFKYLVGFYLERHANGISHKWVSEGVLDILGNINNISKIVKRSRNTHMKYIQSGDKKDLFNTSLQLAVLDRRYVNGKYDIAEHIFKEELYDLENMWDVLKTGDLSNLHGDVYLKPTFGTGSVIVGGASTDIIHNNTIINIKTTENPQFTSQDMTELIGYYMLSKIQNEFDGNKFNIKNVGIYFARYGKLEIHPISDIIGRTAIRVFTNLIN